MLLAERNPFFALDLPFRFGVVEEEHHRGLVIYRAIEFLGRLDFYHPDADSSDCMIVAVPMALLDQHLALEAREIRKLLDCFSICAGKTPGSTAGERAGSA